MDLIPYNMPDYFWFCKHTDDIHVYRHYLTSLQLNFINFTIPGAYLQVHVV